MTAPGGERRNPFAWFAAAGVVVVVAVLGGIALWVLRIDEPPPSPEPAPAARPRSPVGGTPTLARDTVLRAAPAADAPEVAKAFQGTPLRLAGRLEDGSWYAVEVVGRLDALGWVPADALTSTDPGAVPVVTAAGAGRIVTATSPTSDLPNLVFDALFVRRNKLVAVLSNDGYVDLQGPFTVTVGSGAPQQIELPGKSLRPGDRIEAPLDGEYVQRRASVVASVTTAVHEETLEDNHVDLTLEPDMPNDLEVLTVTATPELAVTVRNNSPIPLVGTLNVTLRETRPSTRLLTRLDDAPLHIEAAGTQVFRFPGLTNLDLTRILVLIDTTAINDAALENDTYPR